jgi:ketopantoate reductase
VIAVGYAFAQNAPDHRISALQDLEAQRPLEVNETLGDALGKARRAGLKLPLLESFLPLITAMDRTARGRSKADNEDLSFLKNSGSITSSSPDSV